MYFGKFAIIPFQKMTCGDFNMFGMKIRDQRLRFSIGIMPWSCSAVIDCGRIGSVDSRFEGPDFFREVSTPFNGFVWIVHARCG